MQKKRKRKSWQDDRETRTKVCSIFIENKKRDKKIVNNNFSLLLRYLHNLPLSLSLSLIGIGRDE